jgi:hypothetical protein
MPILNRPKHGLLRPKRMIIISCCLVVLIIIGTVVHTLTAPVHGHLITPTISAKPSHAAATAPQASENLATNPYVALQLPSGFVTEAGNTAPGMLFSQTILRRSIDGSFILNIAIRSLPVGGITADSSYQLRLSQPQNYAPSSLASSGDTISVMTGTANDGVVAFWPHHSLEATLSVTSGLGDGEQADELATLKQVIASWQWLQ